MMRGMWSGVSRDTRANSSLFSVCTAVAEDSNAGAGAQGGNMYSAGTHGHIHKSWHKSRQTAERILGGSDLVTVTTQHQRTRTEHRDTKFQNLV